jgi:hypothetical protein
VFLKHIDLQRQANPDDKKNSKKSLHVLEDGTNGVQVGDIEQVSAFFNFKYDEITLNLWFYI